MNQTEIDIMYNISNFNTLDDKIRQLNGFKRIKEDRLIELGRLILKNKNLLILVNDPQYIELGIYSGTIFERGHPEKDKNTQGFKEKIDINIKEMEQERNQLLLSLNQLDIIIDEFKTT